MAQPYLALFEGQGGWLFSWGFPGLADDARRIGYEADIFRYLDTAQGYEKAAQAVSQGRSVALLGYSLGCTTATYIQTYIPVDLLLCIAESSLGQNHPIKLARRSVLWHGPDFLSDAGVDDRWTEKYFVPQLHLTMDTCSAVRAGVQSELEHLITKASPQ
jgi:hypothetical protein